MARLKSSYVAGSLTVESAVIAGQFVTLGGEGNVTVSSSITANANVLPKFKTDGAFSVIKSIISDNGATATVSGALTATGDIKGASVYLEDDANSSFYLRLYNNSGLSADHTLTLNVGNADRTITLSGSLQIDTDLQFEASLNTANKVLYASGPGVVSGLVAGTVGQALIQGSSLPTWGILTGVGGGTGVNNGTKTITLGGNISTANALSTSGNYSLTLTTTEVTSVTLPASGTLATLAGSENFTNKSYNGLALTEAPTGFTIEGGSTTSKTLTVSETYTLGAACSYSVTDSDSASDIGTGTSLVTERDVYYGLPTINNSHAYNSSTTIYAPSGAGTEGQILVSAGGTSTPTWSSTANADTVDTLHATSFIRSDADDSFSGWLTATTQSKGIAFNSAPGAVSMTSGSAITGGNDFAGLEAINNIAVQTWFGFSVSSTIDGFTVPQGGVAFSVDARTGNVYAFTDFYVKSSKVWHAGNLYYAASSTPGGAAYSVANSITFNSSGGAAAGATFNGSDAKTIDYSTVGAAALNHTHSDYAASNHTHNTYALLNSSPSFTGTVTATSFNASSSRTKKENITDFNHKALDIITSTKIVSYNYKEDASKAPKVGFIAEDTSEVLATKDHNAMDVNSCIGVLLKAVQELNAKIDEQAKEIEELKRPIWKRMSNTIFSRRK